MTKNFWVSWWYSDTGFELMFPWWVGDEDCDRCRGIAMGRPVIFAAVKAADYEAAKRLIADAHFSKKVPDFRFVIETPQDWSPFSGQFKRAHWMQWETPKSLVVCTIRTSTSSMPSWP